MADCRYAVLVAHGSPSDPEPLDAEIKVLAEKVSRLSPGLTIAGGTLAKPGSLEAVFGSFQADDQVQVYPFFMSAGWFVKREVRRRVLAATVAHCQYHAPFGLHGKIPKLCVDEGVAGATAAGYAPLDAVLILAAHGSRKGHAAARAARAVATRVSQAGVFAEVRTGFVEEEPTITQAALGLGDRPVICLPLFAMTAGHVAGDIPEQLDAAAFQGVILPPIGESRDVPRIISETLMMKPKVRRAELRMAGGSM